MRRTIDELVARARAAQRSLRGAGQERVDEIATAVGWACYPEDRATRLAEIEFADTGFGNVPDKVRKLRKRIAGTQRDQKGAVSVGVWERSAERGVTELAKPVGVVAALCPSTHPAADLVVKAMMAIKGANALIACPSPKGARASALVRQFVYGEFDRIGAPRDLLQVVDEPTRAAAVKLMSACDLTAVTGSAKNVRAAYRSGRPALAGGAGNVPVIVDATADLPAAAEMIRQSKLFDYSTACSSESCLLIEASVYGQMLDALSAAGGILLSEADKRRLQAAVWPGGQRNPDLIAKSARQIAAAAGIGVPDTAGFLMVEEDRTGPGAPFSGEKLAPILAVYRWAGFDEAIAMAERILAYQGRGHSCGVHTSEDEHVRILAQRLDVARVIVNQAQGLAEGGSFSNGLDFTMILGCGTWAGTSTRGNVTYRDFLNVTTVSQPIPERVPTDDELWGDYLNGDPGTAPHGGAGARLHTGAVRPVLHTRSG